MSSQEGIKNLLGTKRKGLQLGMIGKVSQRDSSIWMDDRSETGDRGMSDDRQNLNVISQNNDRTCKF